MKKRSIHESSHPFDPYPFEVFSHISWRPVEYLKIKVGAVSTRVLDGRDAYEENVQIKNLRIRSRKATLLDCTCFLRPGIDVCVLSTPRESENSYEEEESFKPVWLDAKIKTVERKRHETGCQCQFHVSFYAGKREDVAVKIDQISILQKLDRNPCENECYRWEFSEDCTSLLESQLFTSKFSSDLTWAVVASVCKQMSFDIRLIQRKIVYQILEYDHNEIFLNSRDKKVALNFKVENGTWVPVVFAFTQGDVLGKQINSNRHFSIYDLLSLRRSKRRNIQPDRYIGCDISDSHLSKAHSRKSRKIHYEDISEDDEYDLERNYEDISEDDEYDLERNPEIEEEPHPIGKCTLENIEDLHSRDKLGEKSSVHNQTAQPQLFPMFHETDQMVLKDLVDSGSEETVSDSFTESEESGLESREKSRMHNQTAQPHRLVPMFHETDQLVLKDLVDSGNCSEKTVSDNFTKSESGTKSREKSSVPDQTAKPSNLVSEMKNQFHPKQTLSNEKTSRAPRYAVGKPEEGFTNARSRPKSKSSSVKFQTRRYSSIYSNREDFRGAWTSGKRSCSATMFKEMMEKCAENIKNNIGKEQPLAIDQWNEIQAAKLSNRWGSVESPPTDEVEKSEVDYLWDEMELSIASMYLLGDNEGSNVEVPQSGSDRSGRVCEHEYRLDEEIGILCQLCGHVETEIKDVLPKFLECSRWTFSKGEFYEGESEHKLDEGSTEDLFSLGTAQYTSLSEEEDNVWALIPDIRKKLRFHQKKAFEFLWRNIAGSLIPGNMQATIKKRGGCVISHSPGAGKTFLIIAFLESYLKLFPGSRPVVLAPKTTLYTWYKEISKWHISVPVYCIHSGSNRKGEASRISEKSPKSNRSYMHILDCMEKIQKWVSGPSVLIMGYPSFLSLTRANTSCSYKQYMARVVTESPGVVILDEGHNPRSTRSGLRKALMRVETKLRILLSGTLFQNNFCEYFNTLTLARPSFVNEVLRELDSNLEARKRKMYAQTRSSLENRARKLFYNRIAKKINAESSEERALGLNMLREMTSGFIDVYEGGNGEKLPGLQCYSLMMKSSPLQEELLVKLGNEKPRHSGYPLELGALITLGSIHPWLIHTADFAKQYFSSEELKRLEKCKSELKLAPKLRFVMSLLPRCLIKNEKVLIFCFYIAPIKLFVEIFESVFGWERGDDFLVLTGDSELFERGRIMDKFEEKGSNSKVMLASITACGEGVSLTAASRLILLDSQWNPSKTKQAIARAFRPGQDKVVYVYQLLALGEEDKYVKNTWKEWVSSMIFSQEIAEDPSKMRVEEIEDDVLREIVEEDGASLFNSIIKNNEKASNDVVRTKY